MFNVVWLKSADDTYNQLKQTAQVRRVNNFLYVQTETHFDAIVDLIWDNMKKDNQGWSTKAELPAGLLAFMSLLPGN